MLRMRISHVVFLAATFLVILWVRIHVGPLAALYIVGPFLFISACIAAYFVESKSPSEPIQK
jgi:hypothetical protein